MPSLQTAIHLMRDYFARVSQPQIAAALDSAHDAKNCSTCADEQAKRPTIVQWKKNPADEKEQPKPAIRVTYVDGVGGEVTGLFPPSTTVGIIEARIAWDRARPAGDRLEIWREGMASQKPMARYASLSDMTTDDTFAIDQEARLDFTPTPTPERATFWSRARLA